jgi:hypothetical protein
MEYWGSRKKDAEKWRLGDPEKNDLFLPISVSPYHPIRILTHYSSIPSFHRSNGFGSSFNVHRPNETSWRKPCIKNFIV